MPYSRVTYTGTGSATEFTLPFAYLTLGSVEVRIDNVVKTRDVDYTINTGTSKVVFFSAPANGAVVKLKRITPRDASGRLVVFSDPSTLDAATLNKSDLQLLYIIQEALDDIAEGVGVGGTGGAITWPGGDPLDDPDLGPILTDIINDHNADVSALSTEVAARAAAIASEHDAWVAALLAETTGRNAAILSARTTLETADTALAAQISVLNAQVGTGTGTSAHARITAEENARASADSAQASRISTLEAAVTTSGTGLLARVSTIESALVTGEDNTALALRVTNLEAKMDNSTSSGLSARIATEEAARASQDSALASSISTLTATVSGVSASVSTEASARATADGNLSGQYVLRVVAGGRVAGMRLTSVSNPAAGDTSEIVFDASAFKVFNGSSAEAPFSVVGGLVCANRLRVGTSLAEVNIGEGIIKQGLFQTTNSGLYTISKWTGHDGAAIELGASGTGGGAYNGAAIYGVGAATSFFIHANGNARFYEINNGTRIQCHPSASQVDFVAGEAGGTATAPSLFFTVKLNGRTVHVPFFTSVP